MTDLLQRRGDFKVGNFTIFAGHQLEPRVPMVVGHAHHHPHLMVMLNPPRHECPHCGGHLPVPEYRVTVDGDDGAQHVRHLGPFGLAYIRAGYVHRVEQITPGALGGFACAFANFDANGPVADILREAEPGAVYVDG